MTDLHVVLSLEVMKFGKSLSLLLIGCLWTAGCGGDDGDAGPTCDDPEDLFPTPVSDSSTPFDGVDDGELFVSFAMGFQFPFFGETYDSLYLNTNGGLTFAGGAVVSEWDVEATEVDVPAIAVFWGDMDAEGYDADTRPEQMTYQQCDDRFIVTYTMFQDYEAEDLNNTATATLFDDGTIEVEYGTVLSEDILVGVMDGSHADDARPGTPLESHYDMGDSGTGIILFDDHGSGPTHTGELSESTIRYVP
ncbi:MAG: hypothetical protein ACOC97_02480 [Myxococcota bacterium]